MEHTIFDDGTGRSFVFFGEDFTSIDFEYQSNDEGFDEEGNFLFEIEDVCRVFDLWDELSIVRLLREKTAHCHDAKESWQLLLNWFEENDIECDVE